MSRYEQPRRETLMKAVPPASKTWFVFDAGGQVLGRSASRIARILMGKHRPTYAPHVDNGDYVVVVNAKDVRLTGKKPMKKLYYRNTGYPHGLRGDAIPLSARIVAVADAYEVMTAGRVYRKALAEEVARAALRRAGGSNLDPHLVEVFLHLLGSQGRRHTSEPVLGLADQSVPPPSDSGEASI